MPRKMCRSCVRRNQTLTVVTGFMMGESSRYETNGAGINQLRLQHTLNKKKWGVHITRRQKHHNKTVSNRFLAISHSNIVNKNNTIPLTTTTTSHCHRYYCNNPILLSNMPLFLVGSINTRNFGRLRNMAINVISDQ